MPRTPRKPAAASHGPALAALLLALLAAACRLRVPPEDPPLLPPPPPELELREPAPLARGAEAPDFELRGLAGQRHRLAEQRGRIVVLEWLDPRCVFVRHGYEEGALGELARRLGLEGVVWWSINSIAPGKPGADPEENRRFAEEHGLVQPILIDADGAVGRAFGATRAPELFVIDVEGRVAYAGPPDDAPFGKVKGGGARTDYVAEVVDALRAGRELPRRKPKPYGCAIRYR